MNIQDYIKEEVHKLDKGIVATPQDREYLESFAKANNGSMDLLLMQMAVQYGYKIALENVQDELKNKHHEYTQRKNKQTQRRMLGYLPRIRRV